MTDVMWGWTFAIAGLLVYVTLFIVVLRQVVVRYRSDTVPKVGWIVALIIWPIAGALAWLLWDNFLRDAVRDRRAVR